MRMATNRKLSIPHATLNKIRSVKPRNMFIATDPPTHTAKNTVKNTVFQAMLEVRRPK